ncbi:MAG: undecaprenyl/decaprenyl-phosphate alpha-N-acetylglucosaminyl 1-phosphate transferase [Candidatus Rokubacteria bacterium]|nr:undecaprenyl/decaprenyl-phosphate alpha-N-acetylglucosaminyl 1-phosphate transferase [Candidatus Rokubacteria bacterium]
MTLRTAATDTRRGTRPASDSFARRPAGAVFGLAAVLAAITLRSWVDVPSLYWLHLATMAFAVTFVGVPAVEWYARWQGVLDQPSARKVHAIATPLLGGVAVFGGYAFTVLVNFQFSRPLKGVALGTAIIVALGVLDDMFDVPAALKLLGQLSAVAVAISYGVMLHVVPNTVPGVAWLNLAVTVLWFLTVVNAVQFLDGMDGLASGLGAIAAVFFSLAALQTRQGYLMYLSAALLGACLGFLPYNFRRGGARIFLGDSGASFIGFALAGFAVMGEWSSESPVIALVTPLLILGVPLFDIAFVGIARVVKGQVHGVGEWLAYTGKDHIHHRFEALGLTKTQSVLLIYFIALTLGLSAMLLKDATHRDALLVLGQAVCVLAIIAMLDAVGRGRPDG